MSAPTVTPLNGGYDQNLLAASPEVSRAARQEGYNVDLLNDDGIPQQQRSIPSRSNTDLENAYHSQAAMYKEGYNAPLNPPRKVPWWRTRVGIVTVVILAIVIIGAVVGGAVGASAGKHDEDTQVQPQVPASSPSVDTSKHGHNSTTISDTGAPTPTGDTAGGRNGNGGVPAASSSGGVPAASSSGAAGGQPSPDNGQGESGQDIVSGDGGGRDGQGGQRNGQVSNPGTQNVGEGAVTVITITGPPT